MNRVLRMVIVGILFVGLIGTHFGCAGSSERESTTKKHLHGGGGGHSH